MGLEMKYFVLKPKAKGPEDPYALASRMAMLEYARVIESHNPSLAWDLRQWVEAEIEEAVKKFKEERNA